MKRGLVIGKFLPIHKGHIALINFAASQCDEVIVSMSFTDGDVIDPALRFSWITSIFKDQPAVKPAMIRDDFDDDALPLIQRTKIWADQIRKIYPPVHVLFSSEEYGDSFSGHLGIPHVTFDPARSKIQISATLIRNHPLKYWDFIPDEVRPHFVKKICFYGPESTGKTVMVERMAELFNTEYVPEVARELLVSNDFSVNEIVQIGEAHFERICDKVGRANKILLCDTDAITTQIYSRYYLQEVPPVLYALEEKVKYDHYFLFDIDVAWVADGLRDLHFNREAMFNIFKEELNKRKIPFTLVKGTYQEREKFVYAKIKAWMD